MFNKKDPVKVEPEKFDFEHPIPKSLYETLLKLMHDAARSGRYAAEFYHHVSYHDLYPIVEDCKFVGLCVRNEMGAYKLVPIEDTELCESEIRKVTESRNVIVEIDKKFYKYRKTTK